MLRLSRVMSASFICQSNVARPDNVRADASSFMCLFSRLYGSNKGLNDIVHHPDVCFRIRNAARHYGQRYHCCPGLFGDAPGNLFRKLRLTYDNRNMLGLHGGDQFLDMAWSWIDARFKFNGAEVNQAEPLREIWPMLVIGHELYALERHDLLLPYCNPGVQLGQIRIAIALEFVPMLWSELHQCVVNVPDRRLCQHRVEYVVRVAVGMNVALVVIGRFGHISGHDAN